MNKLKSSIMNLKTEPKTTKILLDALLLVLVVAVAATITLF